MLPGRRLQGSIFVIDSITAKDIRHFSAIPSEEEVLFPPNSQFKVEQVITASEHEKKATHENGVCRPRSDHRLLREIKDVHIEKPAAARVALLAF